MAVTASELASLPDRERRRGERECTGVPVLIRRRRWGGPLAARLLDISSTGAFAAITGYEFRPGTIVLIEPLLRDGDRDDVLRCTAIVVRAANAGIGLRFI